MSLSTMLGAIVTAVDGISAVNHVAPYDGRFDDGDLDQFQTTCPAVLISCQGFGETEDQGDDIIAPAQWVMSVLTEKTSGSPEVASRMTGAMALVETLTVLIRNSNGTGGAWVDESAGAATKIRAANVHSQKLDDRDMTMWLLTWEQDCSLVAFDTDALDDLLALRGEMDLDADDTYDVQTTVDGAP